MFGLEKISHLQFIQLIALCLFIYYLVVVLYLLVKQTGKEKQQSFESEALAPKELLKTQFVKADELPQERVCAVENTEDSFVLKPDNGVDETGIKLDDMMLPSKMSNVQMSQQLAYAANQEIPNS
ncbi:hypothetical protein [Carboxylicivirga sp. N1Y90]|uniref:hypothetical protein n=1 Tax=Carboxylicivirga fragile TaxID=3417571 RepID=UPI003D341321|nr:hypothetical protein [Marinilabiliaceae bacterium N1Y90]